MFSIFTVTHCASKLLRSITSRSNSSSLRFKSNRENCAPRTGPKCSPEQLAKTTCMKEKLGQNPPSPEKPKSVYQGLWENPECCIEPCKREYPRFDELYYQESDKEKRVYRRTWSECPDLQVKKKRICCFDKLDLPPIERRPRKKDRKGKGCQANQTDLMPLGEGKAGGLCPSIQLPGCKPVRKDTSCYILKMPSNCKKVCTPYPAFSECRHLEFKPLPPRECRCITGVSMCTIWNLLRAGKLKYPEKKKLP